MRKIIFLTYIFLLLSMLSCAPKETLQTREQSLSKGFAMLDEQQYDEAIAYFAELAAKDPHYHVKLAWASAYAARAGVKIDTLYGFVTARAATSFSETSLQNISFGQQTRSLVQNLGTYVAVWEKIPAVSTAASEDLQRAAKVLDGEKVPGVRLYSAALRAVILKSVVVEGLHSWSEMNRRSLCVRDVKPYWDWALRVLENLGQLSLDLQAAFPSRTDIAEASQKLRSWRAQALLVPVPAGDQCF